MRFLTILFAFLITMPAVAQTGDDAVLDFAGDAYRAGATVGLEEEGVDDLFIAGETVTVDVAIGGSGHAAGRRVTLSAPIGGDLYAAGMEVTVSGDVAGDANVTGYDLRVGAVGQDLRATGANIAIEGAIGGAALVAGDTLRIDGAIAGDLGLAGRNITWGPDASVGGVLTIYEEEVGALDVPERVAPADRIERVEVESWEGVQTDFRIDRPSTGQLIAGFLLGVILLAVAAGIIAAIFPSDLAAMRRDLLERPLKRLWIGFLCLSTLTGAAILIALTVIGLIATPAILLAAGVIGFLGYVIAVYSVGVRLLLAAGREEPDSLGDRALAAGVGALVTAFLTLIPFLGWLIVLGLTFAGTGAAAERVLRPRFFATAMD